MPSFGCDTTRLSLWKWCRLRGAGQWRVLMLRGLIDDVLFAADGVPTAATDSLFAELIRLYHAENAEPSVRPPTRDQR